MAVLVVLCATPLVGRPAVLRKPAQSAFCELVGNPRLIVPPTLGQADPSTAKAAAAGLHAIARTHSPVSVASSVRRLAASLATLAAPHGSSARSVLAAKQAEPYASAFAVFSTYRSKHCPAAVPSAGSLGATGGANEIACVTDAATIRAAEDNYALLNGGFASIGDLVAANYLRSVSSYYSDVKLNEPPGGYTLVAVPSGPCPDAPVAG